MSRKWSALTAGSALVGTEKFPGVDGATNKIWVASDFVTFLMASSALTSALAVKAPLASPTFTGVPAAPTAAPGTNTTQLATTAFAAALAALRQPIDSDLTDIAALTPSNDDFLQRKAGAWTNRTVAQVRADLLLAGVPYVFAQDAPATSHTADTVESSPLATLSLLANTMGAKGQVEIDILVSITGTAGAKTLRVYLGVTLAATISISATTLSQQVHVRIANKTASTQTCFGLGSVSGYGASTSAPVPLAISTASNQSITITGQLANAADTITLESYSATVKYSA